MTNEDHIAAGRFYKIPECCIAFYVNWYLPIFKIGCKHMKEGNYDLENFRIKYFESISKDISYIPCPKCITH